MRRSGGSLRIVAAATLVAFASTCVSPSLMSLAAAGRRAKKKDEEDPSKKALVPLTITCATPGATVAVDSEPVGMTPMEMPVPVAAGDHTIKVTKLGYAPYIDVFSTKGKKDVKLELELVPVSGVLHVKSNVPGARVLVDGRYVGEAPLDVEADTGPRAVQVSKGGYKDFCARPQRLRLASPPRRSAPPRRRLWASKAQLRAQHRRT